MPSPTNHGNHNNRNEERESFRRSYNTNTGGNSVNDSLSGVSANDPRVTLPDTASAATAAPSRTTATTTNLTGAVSPSGRNRSSAFAIDSEEEEEEEEIIDIYRNNNINHNRNSRRMENTQQTLNQPLSFEEEENFDDDGNNNNHEQDQESPTQSSSRRNPFTRRVERRRGPRLRSSGPRAVFNSISSSSPPSSPSPSPTPTLSSPPPPTTPTTPTPPESTIPEKHQIAITILDSAQKKFELVASIKWTTKKLKVEGYKIHSVPPTQQRLISMGKLLQDDTSLEDQGIGILYTSGNTGTTSSPKAIIHLFPKPNVVITDNNNQDNNNDDNNNSNNNNNNNSSNNSNTNDGGGAHVPQIILDSEEISRRGQILVLSSHEAYESMHRVRLLSFLLLAYSTLQILRDVTIYLAPPDRYLNDDTIIPPGDPTDTSSSSYEEEDELPSWQTRYYAEITISGLGIYVALLGMKATTDHVGSIAKRFLVLLGVLGLLWTIYTFYCHVIFNVALEKALGENDVGNRLALRVSLLETTLPFFLWVMFYVRALQFYTLIREAEIEANDRALNLMPSLSGGNGEVGEAGMVVNETTVMTSTVGNSDMNGALDIEAGSGGGEGGNGNGNSNGNDARTNTRSGRNANNDLHYDLELQVENRTIT